MADSINNNVNPRLALPTDTAYSDFAKGNMGIPAQVQPELASQLGIDALQAQMPLPPMQGMGDVHVAERQTQLDQQALMGDITDPSLQQQVDPSQFALPQQQPAVDPAAMQAQLQPSQTQNQYMNEFLKQQKAIGNVAKEQAESSELQAAEYDKTAKNLEATQHQLQNIKQEYQKNFDNTLQEFNSASQKVKDTKFQDYWDDKSTGQKVMAGIAIMLGGYGAGLRGDNVNTGLNVVNANIDRDIQRQKMEFEKNKDAAMLAQNKFALYNQKFDNERMAELAMKDNALAASQAKITQIAESNKSPQILEQAKIATSQIEQQRLQNKMMFEQAAKQQALLRSIGQQSGRTLSPQEEMLLAKTDPKGYEVYRDQAKRAINPTSVTKYQGFASNEELAKDFSKYRSEVEPAIAGAQRILAASKDLNKITDLTKRAQIATEMKALVGQLRLPFTGPGQLTEKEYDRLLDTIGDPNKLMSLPTLERVKLNTVLTKLNGDLDRRAEATGLSVPKKVKIDFNK